ncbi:MAG: polysaccharide biosynthesis C-terminal domain-containing protein, partial [Chlamydiia bacterium]|nr:polysaccharide biosynthesis C-terminal domain-containing protein [Chlamydiia bacterium]
PAHLWYASRVQQLPMALFGIALAGALLPPLSRAARSDDHARFGSLLCFALERSYLLIFSCTCLLFFGGYSVIDLLFGHGEFSDTDALHTTHCLWAYSAGLLPIVWILITASAFYARGDYQTPTKAALAGMGTNVAANTLCIGVFGAGAWSVAAATSVAAFVNAGWLLQALIKQGYFQWSTELSRRLQKSTVSCIAATLAALAFLSVLPNFYTKGSTTQNLIDCVGLGLVYTGVLAGLEWKKRSGQFA